MHVLDITTVLFCGLLAGNELTISLFINPALWKLNDLALIAELARVLGIVMPFLYALCLILLGTELWLHRHTDAAPLLLAAAVLWALSIPFTLLFLVPRNNRLAASTPSDPPAEILLLHRQWDTFHRVRIAALILAVVLLIGGLDL